MRVYRRYIGIYGVVGCPESRGILCGGGALKIRSIVFWGLHWGSLILGKYHMGGLWGKGARGSGWGPLVQGLGIGLSLAVYGIEIPDAVKWC